MALSLPSGAFPANFSPDWTPTGITSFIMLAGSAAKVTDFDGWMLRNWWYELSRERGWQTGVAAASSVKTTSTAKATSTVKTTSVKATTTAKATTTKATTTAKATTTKATTTAKASVKTTTTAKATATAVASKATASKWQQCGGANWTGATQCESGSTCTKQNDYYSQCL